MAWQDLDSDLAEMFGELASPTEKTEAALYIKSQWQSAEAKEYMREWRRLNRARCNEYIAEWRAANPEKVRAYRRRWYEKHADRERARGRESMRKMRAARKAALQEETTC